MDALFDATLAILLLGIPLAVLWSRAGAAAAVLSSGGMIAVGLCAAAGWRGASLTLGSWLGYGATGLRIDPLAGLFFGLIGVLSLAVSLRYLERPPTRLVTALHCALVFTLGLVVSVGQAFAFLYAWEALTVLLYLTASADRGRPGTLLSGYLTGVLNKISGAALLAAFGLLYRATGSFSFADWHVATMSSGIRDAVFVLLLVGFAAKVGLAPLQAALPASYHAAPGPAAASLSIALVAGFYGFWRLLFQTLAPAPLWWGEALLVVGAVTALTGVIYAIAQDDIRRFLGFSSVEHSGVALLGLGAALIGQATDERELVAAGMLAATLHVIAHALAKTLALLAAERLAEATGTSALGPLGGLARSLPRSSVGLGMATLTLAALPPFGGFVSEWFTLEALLQGFRVDSTIGRLLMALAAAALALTAGLGLLAFAKLFGTVILGKPRSRRQVLGEPGLGSGMLVLAGVTVVLGFVAPWEITLISDSLLPTLGFDAAATAVSHPLVLGPVYPGFSVLAPTWLSVTIPALAAVAAALVAAARRRPARRAAPWVCGTALAPELVQYSPAGYSNPIRVVLRSVYGFRRRVVVSVSADGEQTLELESSMVAPIEDRIYRPLTTATLALTAYGRRLQSGRLSAYLAYLLFVLLIVLALIPTLRG
jgi:formate hydrogenlyase subunit 3/multisubunit Na+/H+ antiporter MnhD subunit